MSVAPLTGQFIQAGGYSTGRRRGAPKWVVLHTAEGSTEVVGLGNFFAGETSGSSNCGLGQQGEYADYVRYDCTPWTNPPINTLSDTAEMCAFRAWSRTQWLEYPKLLEVAAHWVAWRCAVRGLPIRLITGQQAAAGLPGVLDHKMVNDGFHASDHTDVGPGFPWDIVIPRAQAIAGAPIAAVSHPQPKTAMVGKDRVLGLYSPPCTGQDVVNVQHALRVAGNNITIDGIYGKGTADLIQVFKDHRNIHEAGVGKETWAALRALVHG